MELQLSFKYTSDSKNLFLFASYFCASIKRSIKSSFLFSTRLIHSNCTPFQGWRIFLKIWYFCLFHFYFIAFFLLVLFEISISQLLVLGSLILFLKLSSLLVKGLLENVMWLLFNCFASENWCVEKKTTTNKQSDEQGQ